MLVGLIVRRPGAAFFGGVVSAAVSVLLGSPYGFDALISGALQGGGAEVAFAIGLYRRWTLPSRSWPARWRGSRPRCTTSSCTSRTTAPTFWAMFAGATVVSGALVAGVGAWLLMRALIATGVLREFAAGREARRGLSAGPTTMPAMADGAKPARIEARGWGLRHPGRRDWALRGLDLTIEPGERVLLLGRRGRASRPS